MYSEKLALPLVKAVHTSGRLSDLLVQVIQYALVSSIGLPGQKVVCTVPVA